MKDTTFRAGTAAGLALAASLVVGEAVAQTQSVSGFQRVSGKASQDLTIRNNSNFAGRGTEWNTVSRLSFTLRAENNRSQLSATTGSGFRLNSNGNGSIIDPTLGLRFATGTRRLNINASANYSDREISYDEVQPDLSTISASGDRQQLRLSFGANTALTQTTSVAVSANYGQVTFTPNTVSLVETVNYGISASVNHQITARTRASLNGGLSFFEPETGLDAVTTSVGGGLNHSLNRNTSVNANFGISLSESDLAGGGSQSDTNFTYGLGVNRQLPSGSVSASLRQQILPSATGSLRVNTGLRAGYSERINQRERFGVNASYDIQEGLSGGGSTTFLSVSPNYSVQLGRDLSANAAYSLQRNDAGDFAQSLNFSLSKDFNLPF